MASTPSTGPPHPPQIPPDSSLREPNPGLSWDGERMFNIYIYDYCFKRGFRKTARELLVEADLGGDAIPPINARQGLLYEWWSVFWVLFQTKSGNLQNEDAMLYIQHQNAQKAAQRMQTAPVQQPQPGPHVAVGNQPPQTSSNPQPQPQAPINRMPNGMPIQRQPSVYHTNGATPNGINPAMGGQPTQPGQQPMQGPSTPINFVAIGGQANGVPGAQQQPQQGSTSTTSFNPMMGGAPAQRHPMNGQPQQPGQQSGRGPFTSPPMAHSPQGGPAGGQPTPQGPPPPGQPGPQAPMTQLGPSPHMTRTMLPPNGTPSTGMNAQMNPSAPQGAPPSAFPPGPGAPQGPNGVRPPSRSRPTPSPSMSARQPPGTGVPQQQAGMGMMMMNTIPGAPMGGMNLGGIHGGVGVPGSSQESALNQELVHIPHATLNLLRHDLGYGDKDVGTMNIHDKARIVNLWKQRNAGAAAAQQQRKESASGMLPHQSQGMHPRAGPQHPSQPGAAVPNNRLKRGSTSPPEENALLPRNESSPPERKRIKRSPTETPAIPPGYPPHLQTGHPGPSQPGAQPPTSQQNPMPANPQHPGQPGPGGPQGQMPSQQPHVMMFRPPMAVTGGNGHGGQMAQGQPGPPGATMSQPPSGIQVMNMPMHPGQAQPPQLGLFRPGGGPPGAAGPTAATAVPQQFNSTPLTRLGQPRPNLVGMLPSSGMNGPPKEGPKDNKPPQTMGHTPPGVQQQGPEVSPRNAPTGTTPSTPAASSQATGLPPQVPPPPGASGAPSHQPPAPGSQQQQPAMTSMLMNIPGMPDMNAADLSMFEPNFMEEFGVFKSNDDINFERDFGQWFNSVEDTTGLDLK